MRGTTAVMWAADQGHADAVKLLVEHNADLTVQSKPASRGRTAYLGKANDPRKSNRAWRRGAAATPGGTARKSPCSPGKDNRRAPSRRTRNRRDSSQGPLHQRAGNLPPRRRTARTSRAAAGSVGGTTIRAAAASRRWFMRPGANSLDTVKALLEAGADINQTSGYGWSPLLVATQNRFYQLGSYLLEHGADPNKANKGGWTPLYLAVDNRNIEGGDYPVRKGDMDHLDFIKKLLDKGADVNARMKDSTETRTVFTNQWLDENGATAFLRASQSSDLEVMRLLLARGADPKIATVGNVTALQVAAGIGWVDGLTYEWSEKANVETVKLLLDLGVDPNVQAETGRTALHGAGHKGRTAVIQLLVDAGAKLETRDYGMTGNDAGGRLAVHTWQPVDYADGLVRVGVQSAVAHPEAGLLLRKLMVAQGMEAPPMNRTLASVCITEICDDVQ